MKILIIEDDITLIIMIKKILSKTNHEILVAETGIDGIKKINKDKPDLILLDRGLPDIDGLNISREIFNDEKKYGVIPIIIITGMNKEIIEEECLKLGVISVIEKPFNIENLRLKIDNIKKMIKYKGKTKKEKNKLYYHN